MSPPPRRRLRHPTRILLLAAACGLPGMVTVCLLLWAGDYTPKLWFTVFVVCGGAWLVAVWVLRERVVRPLQTASNMLSALREGDFSIYAATYDEEDPLGQLWSEINQLTRTLQAQRMGAVEALALLNKVVEEIDIAVFTIDPTGRLRLINRMGEKLLAQPASQLVGRAAVDVGLGTVLEAPAHQQLVLNFPGRSARWFVKRGTFREDGQPHTLLLLADVSQPLRDEERTAWRRLIRVLGHELNNSMAPIKSLSGSLARLVSRDPLPEDWREDLRDGLDIIAQRTESLSRFVDDYSRLARLPAPHRQELAVAELIQRVAHLQAGRPLRVEAGDDVTFAGDAAQLEQMLINLLKNALEAAQETGGAVILSWQVLTSHLEIRIVDDGPGIANLSNLFVPFFSTKPGGSGIGLTLSRHIAEGHGGTLELENRSDRAGAVATVLLPLTPVEA